MVNTVLMNDMARKHHCSVVQNRACSAKAMLRPLGDPLLGFPKRSPSSVVFRRAAVLDAMMSSSHMSHGSDSLLATALPIISSEKIWPTRAVRQPFSRSSVGSRMARKA